MRPPSSRNFQPAAALAFSTISDNYRLLSERSAQIAKRPAIVFSMQFSGSDSPALLRQDVAIVDAGTVFYFIHFGATQARYAGSSPIFKHVIDSIGFAE